MSRIRARTTATRAVWSTKPVKSAASSRRRARSPIVPATVESDTARIAGSAASRTPCTAAIPSSTPGSRQSSPSGQRTTTSAPKAPPNSSSTWSRARDEAAPRGRASATRLSASSPAERRPRPSVARRPTAAIPRAWRTDQPARKAASREALRDDRPSRMPRKAGREARRGVRSVTAVKLASAPAAAATPKVRTASIRAAASDAKPIAVTRLVRPQAVPTRRIAPAEAADAPIPRRALRRMSSMKWIESHVPTTRASDGTTLVRMLIFAPHRPSTPIAHTAPTSGGTQATTVEEKLRATLAERIRASDIPSALKTSMSRRSACDASARRAGRPVSSASSPSRSASVLAIPARTPSAAAGVSRPGRSRTRIRALAASAERRWPAMSGCLEQRASAAAQASSSSGPDTRGMTGRRAPAMPCRRTSNIERTPSTPSIRARSSTRSRRFPRVTGAKSGPVVGRTRTMQSRSGAPKRAAISSMTTKSSLPLRRSDRRSSSIRSRESPTAARREQTTVARITRRRQPGSGSPRSPPGMGRGPSGGGAHPDRRSIPGNWPRRSGSGSRHRPASSNQ